MPLNNAMLATLLEDENDVVRDLARHIVEYRRILEKAQGHKRDASRYRWLRDTNSRWFRGWSDKEGREFRASIGAIDTLMVFDQPDSSTNIEPQDMDAIVDAAMKEWPS